MEVEIGVGGVVEVEIGNPWVLDYGFGWRRRWRWLGLVRKGWVFLGLVGVEINGRGGRFCWRGLGEGWVFLGSGFGRGGLFFGEGWVFLGLVRVGGDRWLGWSFLLEKAGFFWV